MMMPDCMSDAEPKDVGERKYEKNLLILTFINWIIW